MGLGLKLIPHEILEVLGLKRRGKETFPEFLCAWDISRHNREQSGLGVGTHLNIAHHVLLDRGEGNGAEKICHPSC